MDRFDVLIVTSEHDLASLARERLRDGGWNGGIAAVGLRAALQLVDGLAVQVILVDAELEMSARALSELTQKHPGRPALLVVSEANLHSAMQALNGGALGCIARNAPAEEWRGAVEAVSRGELWVRRGLLSLIVRRLLAGGAARAVPTAVAEPLTEREREIARYVLSGLSNKEIGLRLEICNSTVKTHLHRVYAKLGLHRRTQLIGVASPPEGAVEAVG